MLHTNEVADISERMIEQKKLLVFYQEGGIYMKQDTLEGKAKTKNGVKISHQAPTLYDVVPKEEIAEFEELMR